MKMALLNDQTIKGMPGYVQADSMAATIKIDNAQQAFVACFSDEGIDFGRVETGIVVVGVNQFKEYSIPNGSLVLVNFQQSPVIMPDHLLFLTQFVLIPKTIVFECHHGIDAPIIKNATSSILPAETFVIHSPFTQFLTGIDHERVDFLSSQQQHGWKRLARISGKKVRSNPLFIVVFQKMQHVLAEIVDGLPATGDGGCWRITLHDPPKRIVHTFFVIQQIKHTVVDEIPISRRLIDFGNKR